MSKYVWEYLTGVAVLAIVYMLVRPGSPAAQAVKDISDALQTLIRTSTSYNFNGEQ